MNINVKKILGNALNIEDAIVLRRYLEGNQNVELDFEGIDRVPSTCLNCLFADMINKEGRDIVANKVEVKNLSNYNDYSRVVLGTTFC